jgi:hypothetical protein
MTQSKGKKYHSRFSLDLDDHIRDLVKQRSFDEDLSENKLIVKALTLYLTKDIEDESLLIAKMTETQRQLEFLQKKIDLSQKKDIQWEIFLLALQPELPADSASRDIKIKRANQRYLQFLTQFRNRSRQLPSMLESVLGDMHELPAEPSSAPQKTGAQ